MDRPLWQILLSFLVVAFVVRRGALGFVLYAEGAVPVLLAVAYAAQGVLGLGLAAAIWLGRALQPAVVALALAVAATAVLETVLGMRSAAGAVAEVVVVAGVSALFVAIFRHEFSARPVGRGEPEPARSRTRPDAQSDGSGATGPD